MPPCEVFLSDQGLATWRQIAHDHPAVEIVVVSDGAAIAIGLTVLLHGGPRGWPRYSLRNASVTSIVLDESPQLVTLNAVEHLEEESAARGTSR